MAISLIAQSDIEAAIGVNRTQQLSDDDQDGVADPDIINLAIDVASSDAYGYLLPGYPDPVSAKNLVDNDTSARFAVADLAIAWLGLRPTEFSTAEGMAPFTRRQDMAIKKLNAIGRGTARSAGEPTAGLNPNISATLSKGAPAFDFVFATNRGRPNGRGGF